MAVVAGGQAKEMMKNKCRGVGMNVCGLHPFFSGVELCFTFSPNFRCCLKSDKKGRSVCYKILAVSV